MEMCHIKRFIREEKNLLSMTYDQHKVDNDSLRFNRFCGSTSFANEQFLSCQKSNYSNYLFYLNHTQWYSREHK